MFRNTFSLLLLLPLLAGTLGISAMEHRCNSSNKVNLKLFPELGDQAAGCCCSAESPTSGQAGKAGSENLDPLSCCKTIHWYVKANFQTTQTRAPIMLRFSHVVPGVVLPPDTKLKCASLFGPVSFLADTGPPVTGRQRIISFHKPKIPCPPHRVC